MHDPEGGYQLKGVTDSVAARGLQGRTAVVTGAASGMGRVMARSLAHSGARIVAVDIQPNVSAVLAREVEFASGELIGITADLSEPNECEAAAKEIFERAGGCDVLVNCAGVSMNPVKPEHVRGLPRFWEVDPQALVKLINLNTTACLLMARHLAPGMIDRGWGRIVNVTTSFDTMLGKGMNAYGASKAAVEAATLCWAKELEGTGVTANVLVPGGAVRTPFLPQDYGGPALEPGVMFEPISFLASDEAGQVNGRRIVAQFWDAALSTDENLTSASAAAAWPELAVQAMSRRP